MKIPRRGLIRFESERIYTFEGTNQSHAWLKCLYICIKATSFAENRNREASACNRVGSRVSVLILKETSTPVTRQSLQRNKGRAILAYTVAGHFGGWLTVSRGSLFLLRRGGETRGVSKETTRGNSTSLKMQLLKFAGYTNVLASRQPSIDFRMLFNLELSIADYDSRRNVDAPLSAEFEYFGLWYVICNAFWNGNFISFYIVACMKNLCVIINKFCECT